MLDFASCFRALTGYEPFHWQSKLYERLLHGELPDVCDIPTGLGKTSIITIWLIALAELLNRDESWRLPRRLVYVVDRRTVVDQATTEAEKLIDRITKPDELIVDESEREISRKLAQILIAAASSSRKEIIVTGKRRRVTERQTREASSSREEIIIALSRLRGQQADNREWCLDPTRPAIIIGTVDMIGSRLLFTGYGGVGRYHRSLQAGLLGQDALIVVDEAHLSPTFVKTARDVFYCINQYTSLRRSFLMTLSATTNDGADEEGDESRPPLSIFGDDELADDFQDQGKDSYQRLYANKQLSWLKVSAPVEITGKAGAKAAQERMADAVVECAAQYFKQNVSVVIYLNTVEAVNQVREKLEDAMQAQEIDDLGKRILNITGEMRGCERDRLLVKSNVLINGFKRRKKRETQDGCYFLIATAAAEVGIDFDADHGICDLVALERMIQRFGRINRFGDGAAKITVVLDEQSLRASEQASQENRANDLIAKGNIKPLEQTAYHTYLFLQSHAAADGSIDVSPVSLRALEYDRNALTAPPVRPPLDVARIDDWSLTSLKQNEYPRPLVAYWLRGVISDDTVQTTFCWRADLSYAVSVADATAIVEAVPIAPRERAEVAVYRAITLVKELVKASPEKIAVLVDVNGGFTALRLGSLQDVKDDELRRRLSFATLVLPQEVGGLDKDGNPQQKLSRVTKSDYKLEDAVDDEQWVRLVITKKGKEYYAQELQNDGSLMPNDITDLKRFLSPKAATDDYGKRLNRQCVFISNKGATQEEIDEEDAEDENVSVGIQHKHVAYLLRRDAPEHFLRGDDNASLNMRRKLSIPEHNADVERYAKEICQKINIEPPLASAIVIAASRHDTGKARRCWQRAIGNEQFINDKAKALAKSDQKRFDLEANAGYRHEFGSLIDALNDDEINAHPHRDLILHLIAAHHGYARPYFPERAFDLEKLTTQENRQLAGEVMQRFARLQREYGWWQLAYLEALLKTADGLASSEIKEKG
ncbi:MAG: type I-U CRISPR-associated helicase/endonuclease Cas3 [Pyrinomonadaceae bacterium]